MTGIRFARTRWTYDSYVDFWKLVELSGFSWCYIDEMESDNPGLTYIVSPMNGEWPGKVDGSGFPHKAKMVLWNLERPSGSGGVPQYQSDNLQLIQRGLIDKVIVSDYRLSKITGFEFVPLGSHKDLGQPGDPSGKLYDVAPMCCYSNHRSFLFEHPNKLFTSINGVSIAPNAWGEERDKILRSTRFLLNIHQDGIPFIEPLRFSLAAAYGLPIITEAVYNPYPYGEFVCVIGNWDSITEALNDYDIGGEGWANVGFELRERMTTDYSFRACLEDHL